MRRELSKYEKDIEDNFSNQESIKPLKLLEDLQSSAIKHLKNRKPITIRVSNQDLEAIKLKASKMGLAYQTYLNMLIHQDASKF